MKDIFAEFYTKVIGFFRRTEEQVEESSKDVARNRLRVVLMQDRTNLTPELLERMRKELIELLSKYVEMDKEALELNLEQEGDQMALMLSIPVLRARDKDEIVESEKSENDDNQEEVDLDENAEDTENIEDTENAETQEAVEDEPSEIIEELKEETVIESVSDEEAEPDNEPKNPKKKSK